MRLSPIPPIITLLTLFPMDCHARATEGEADAAIDAVMEAAGINDAIDAACDAVGLGDDGDD